MVPLYGPARAGASPDRVVFGAGSREPVAVNYLPTMCAASFSLSVQW